MSTLTPAGASPLIQVPVTGPQAKQAELPPASAQLQTAEVSATDALLPIDTANMPSETIRSAEIDPLDPQVQFGNRSSADFDVDSAINDLRSDFVVNNKVRSTQREEFQTALNELLSNPEARSAMISRYNLDSPENKSVLAAAGAIESGRNGDMGETMTTIMNRAIAQNLMYETTNRSDRVDIMDILSEKVDGSTQFSSEAGVKQLLETGRTEGDHQEFLPQANQIAEQIYQGTTNFTSPPPSENYNPANNFYFKQGSIPAGADFSIGVHDFSDRWSRKVSYAEGFLHDKGIINWGR